MAIHIHGYTWVMAILFVSIIWALETRIEKIHLTSKLGEKSITLYFWSTLCSQAPALNFKKILPHFSKLNLTRGVLLRREISSLIFNSYRIYISYLCSCQRKKFTNWIVLLRHFKAKISPMNITNPNLISHLNSEQDVGYTFKIPKDVAILFLVILPNSANTPVWLYFFSGYTSKKK